MTINKIEQVAKLLLKHKIEFEYQPEFLRTRNGMKIEPLTFTYHANTNKLICMNWQDHEIPIEYAIELIKKVN